jgi:hypothetical protein
MFLVYDNLSAPIVCLYDDSGGKAREVRNGSFCAAGGPRSDRTISVIDSFPVVLARGLISIETHIGFINVDVILRD